MVKAAKAVSAAADIGAAREAFGPLSDAVIAAARAEGFKDLGDVKVAFCPMVKKSWLQKGDEIRNPYFGSAMSTCGEIKK
jgi:Cu(I)/Ag(I) efflux system membrane fusion protein